MSTSGSTKHPLSTLIANSEEAERLIDEYCEGKTELTDEDIRTLVRMTAHLRVVPDDYTVAGSGDETTDEVKFDDE